ncbi:MAG: hypothetical protein HUK40_10465 [Desulfobacter sp.]|nr:hypothetical protein [Desulfobacter sp.]
MSDNGYYIGNDEDGPEIGDLKIRFAAVMPTDITLVAQQKKDSFGPYTTSTGGQIEELSVGLFSAAAMFKNAQSANTLLAWGLRCLGVFLMMIGFFLLFNPLSVIADVVPFIGNIVEFGIGIIAFLLTLILSAIVIAIAWIFYRPVIALLILTGAVVVAFLAVRAKKRQ